MHYLYFRFVCIVAVSLFISCKGPKPKIIKSPPYYSFKDVFTNKLDARLLEVSGIAWDSHIDKFYAHNDESGTLFILERETKSVMNAYKFAGRGDYEDVAIFRHIPYVLRSDGTILKILIDSVAGTARAIESPKLDITGSRDFETMYTDTTRNALIIVCNKEANGAVLRSFPYGEAIARVFEKRASRAVPVGLLSTHVGSNAIPCVVGIPKAFSTFELLSLGAKLA